MAPRLLVAIIIVCLPLAHRSAPHEATSGASSEHLHFLRRAEESTNTHATEESSGGGEAALEKLNPVALMSIIVALFAFLVVWETVGGLERAARFWEKWEGTEPPERSGEPGLDGVVNGVEGEREA
jgi:hypothetical protein